MNWYIGILLLLIILFTMGKNKQKRKWVNTYFRDKIDTYVKEFPNDCRQKTLSEIIDNYCILFNEPNSKNYYKNLFTYEELHAIILL